MNYAELVTKTAEETGVSKAKVDAVLKTFIKQTRESVSGGGQVYLPGLGKFRKKHYGTRRFKKIGTDDFVTVQPKDVIHFKPAESATIRRG